MHVLLIDDDKEFANGLSGYLDKWQIHAEIAHTAAQANNLLRKAAYDALLLDVMLPGEDGFAFLPRLRKLTKAPVLMLTALGEEEERIRGLELGADDYITKPFSAKELVARLRAFHRRYAEHQTNQEITQDDLTLLPGRFEARINTTTIPLTAVESRILELMMTSANHILSREQICQHALMKEPSPMDRSLDVHMSNLRRKLGPHPTKGSRIRSIRGLGYSLAS